MRNLTEEELHYLTEEGHTILSESLEYTMEKCSYDMNKLTGKLGKDDVEPEKPKKLLVGNGEIIATLKSCYGIKIKSVAELNGILEEMGIVLKIYKTWYQTEKGKQYSVFTKRIKPANIWTDNLIPSIAEYINKGKF